jgi:hypothetical protein
MEDPKYKEKMNEYRKKQREDPRIRERRNEQQKKRMEKPENKKKEKERHRKQYEDPENRKRIKERNKKWRERPGNREKANAQQKKWSLKNKESLMNNRLANNPHDFFVHYLATNQFQLNTIGTYIREPEEIMTLVEKEARTFDFPEDGIGVIFLPEEAHQICSSGVAKRSLLNDKTKIIRNFRGSDDVYLDRTQVKIQKPSRVSAVVYTKKAYIADRRLEAEITKSIVFKNSLESEVNLLLDSNYEYFWINTIASSGPVRPPVGPERFIKNIAEGNFKNKKPYKAFYNKAVTCIKLIELDRNYQLTLPIEETLAWKFCEYESKNPNQTKMTNETKRIIKYWKDWVVVASPNNRANN